MRKTSSEIVLVKKKKSVSFPEKSFDTVTPSAAKQKQAFTKGIELKLSLYDSRQTVY